MISFFKPEDFEEFFLAKRETAAKANEKLEKALGPKVFFNKENNIVGTRAVSNIDTHEAYLFDVKEIKKEPCKHENVFYDQQNTVGTHNSVYQKAVFKCTKCGKELEPVWREKNETNM